MNYFDLTGLGSETYGPAMASLIDYNEPAILIVSTVDPICIITNEYSGDLAALAEKEKTEYIRCYLSSCQTSWYQDQNMPRIVLYVMNDSYRNFVGKWEEWNITALESLGIKGCYKDKNEYFFKDKAIGGQSSVLRSRDRFMVSSQLYLLIDPIATEKFSDPSFFVKDRTMGINEMGFNITEAQYHQAFLDTFEGIFEEAVVQQKNADLLIKMNAYVPLFKDENWLKKRKLESSIIEEEPIIEEPPIREEPIIRTIR